MVKLILFGLTIGNGGLPNIISRDFSYPQVVQKRGPEKQSTPFWKVLLYLACSICNSAKVWDEISIRQKKILYATFLIS